LSQSEIAAQLGLSERQVRREQHAALEMLATMLWEQFDLESQRDTGQDTRVAPNKDASTGAALGAELAWLRNGPPASTADLNEALASVADLAQPLADQHAVHLVLEQLDPLPPLAVHPVALTQMLLNVLGVAFHRAPGGRVKVSVRPVRWEIEIQVQGDGGGGVSQATAEDDTASLDLARQLAVISGGQLAVDDDAARFTAVLTLPAREQLPILAIDDSADTLQLLKRYTADTRYRLVGARDPEQALDLAQRLAPQVILLDVMMPQVDGWRVLRRLRQHPLTDRIPVVVCTIVGQEELALSLGASAFLKKPVARQEFLAALDQQLERMGSGSR
jgi:CheY-like chemotaxis protein